VTDSSLQLSKFKRRLADEEAEKQACQSRIAVLETDVSAARAEITSLRAAVAAQDGSLSQLQARVCGLEQQLQVRFNRFVISRNSFSHTPRLVLQSSQEDNASKASLIAQVPPPCHCYALRAEFVIELWRENLIQSQLQATVAARDAFIKDLEDQARVDAQERRKLHNMVQELKGWTACKSCLKFVLVCIRYMNLRQHSCLRSCSPI
jgi:uncharacterized coiled-coil protein SlyX